MKVYVNQQACEVPDGLTVKAVLYQQQIPAEGTALAVDNKLVSKGEGENRVLMAEDKITVIRATF